ncbi:unnamed protein product, partial [Schistosoma mattheei]
SSDVESDLSQATEKHIFIKQHKQLFSDSLSHPNCEKSTDDVQSIVSKSLVDKADNEQAPDDHHLESCEQEICAHHYQRCGELEATWGKGADQDVPPCETSGFHVDKTHEKQVCKTVLDESNEEKICAYHYQRCGELEATWGKAADSSNNKVQTSEKHEEMLSIAPGIVPSGQSGCTYQLSDETETTSSKPKPANTFSIEDTMQQPSSSSSQEKLTKTIIISKHTKSDKDDNIIQNNMEKVMKSNHNYYNHSDKLNDDTYEFPDRVIAIPQMEPVDPTEILFDDTYYNNILGDLLQGRSILEPLTPIPETSEYSTRSSVTSINPSKSWQSSDLSPSDSIEIRPGGGAVTNVSRRPLHPFSHSNRTSHESFSGPQKSFKNPALSVHSISSIHSEPDRIRRSYEAHSMESPGQDCHMDLSSSLRTHSSRSSSLAEFLRLETSCDGSRGDLCIDVDNDDDDDKRLCEHDQNLHDLIQSIQELQRQHLDESTGLITPPSGDEDSSNSRLAIGSNDIDRQIGESIRNAELESSVSLLSASSLPQVNTTSRSEMQQLLQPIYMSSSSLNSSAPQPSPPSTTTAKLPVGITCRVNQYS